jgi:hypothetical protein
MADHKTEQLSQGFQVFWGPVSLAIPLIVVLVGLLFVASASKGVGGDMVGPAFFVYAVVALGIAGVFGLAAAIRAIAKREDWITLAFVGLLLNLVFVGYGALCASHLLR